MGIVPTLWEIMNIVHSILKAFPPIHRQGYPFIAGFFITALILAWLWKPLFYIGLGLTIWCIFFFRDPKRVTIVHDDCVMSPADGRVSSILECLPPAELGLGTDPMLRISVFMNVFNCHVNRSPVQGSIEKIIYKPGRFINAELDKASVHNERNSLIIASPHGQIAVVQIAGLIARRIVCWGKKGEQLVAGERFGLIRFGSRVDVFLPLSVTPTVAHGQTAIAGETVIARFHGSALNLLTRTA